MAATHVENATTTETGAYTLNGDTTSGLETKNTNAQWWIPSENEWYKAAYYDPNKGGLGVGGYWSYATRSNSAPGNVLGSGVNEANYFTGVYSVTQIGDYYSSQNYLTAVGAFTNSASAYGTYDQAGNVWNWNDAVISGSYRGQRGDSWDGNSLQSSSRFNAIPEDESPYVGFRVATVPEPSSIMLMGLGGLGLALLGRRRSKS